MTWLGTLFRNPGETDISHSRLISLLAFLVVSFVILKQLWLGLPVDTELLLGYMGIAMLGKTSEVVSRHRRDVEYTRIRGKVDDPDA